MNEENTTSSSLTKYPTASLRELLVLGLPLILSLFSASFMGFCDRLYLAHYSLEAWEGSVSAGYLCMLFQHPIIRITSMAQVFVGLYYGSKRLDRIGSTVWQMIWLSLLSICITLPISWLVGPLFFGGTAIKEHASIYFNTMMLFNFLFPLGTAIASFFIGQGRTRIILMTTLFAHGLNIALDYVFIFGIKGIIPSMGTFGAALATGVSQSLFCLILFFFFLRKKDKELYGTHKYQFDSISFWKQFRVGLPRAVARVMILGAWVAISRIMTLKGGDHLIVLTVGGTLIFLFTFINDGMCQAMITIASNLLGARDYSNIWKLARSGLVVLFSATTLLAIPYLVYPSFTLSFFFITPPDPTTLEILKRACIWLWLFFLCYGLHCISLSLITAARDVTFYMLSICLVWFTSYLPAYLGMNVFNWSADKVWLIMALDSLIFGVLFFLRASKEKWKEIDQESLTRGLSN